MKGRVVRFGGRIVKVVGIHDERYPFTIPAADMLAINIVQKSYCVERSI
jgi:hypothetical protein